MQCHKCGTIVVKIHAKHENEIVGIKESYESIHDQRKVVMESSK
ncbi:MAG TPA: hypothetical protein VFV86_12505 [Nitrososphaeraceae archaeon]|nr:hypothetical protein [Nitrososphaeraceae archaeon]